MKCFHHNDADGRCAAAIVHKFRPDSVASDFIEVDYRQDPDFLSIVKPEEEVFIVDFSFRRPAMGLLMKITDHIVWIDHHATAKSYGYSVKGLRDFSNKGLSGCELTWQYFSKEQAPLAVRLVGDYDSWRLADPRSLPFYEGLKLEDQAPCSETWKTLFNYSNAGGGFFGSVIDRGAACIQYRDMYCAEMRKMAGFETTIAGFKAYALNVYKFGSQAFGDLIDKYQVVVSYVHDGTQYTVSVYSKDDSINCGEICKLCGGGGHRGAAGFVCKTLPFVTENR